MVNGKSANVPIGDGVLKKGYYFIPNGDSIRVASMGAWIAPDTLQVRNYFYETPFYFTHNFAFNKDEVTIIRTSNVNMGPATKVELKGTKK